MQAIWVAALNSRERCRERELADDGGDKNWIATPKGRKRKKADGTWQYDYSKPGTGKKAATAKQTTPKKAGSKPKKARSKPVKKEAEKEPARAEAVLRIPANRESDPSYVIGMDDIQGDRPLIVEHLTGLQPKKIGGTWIVSGRDKFGSRVTLAFQTGENRATVHYKKGDKMAAQSGLFSSMLYGFTQHLKKNNPNITDDQTGESFTVTNWEDGRNIITSDPARSRPGDPVTGIRDSRGHVVSLTGEARRMALSYLYGDMPGGALLDRLKDLGYLL